MSIQNFTVRLLKTVAILVFLSAGVWGGSAQANGPDGRPHASEAEASGLTLHVSPTGADEQPGTQDKPFATLERARDEIRALRGVAGLPAGGVVVNIGAGIYPVRQTFELTADDSGTPEAPIVYRAQGGMPVFSGGLRVEHFGPVTDESVLARLPEESRVKVMQADLKPLGIATLPPLTLGGFASGNGFKTHAVIELFCDGEALPMARYPNEGMLKLADISVPDGHSIHGLSGSKTGRVRYEGDRPARWTDEKDAMLYGYWFFDWADSYERIIAIRPDAHEIELAQPYHTYGYRKGARYYAINLLSEIDASGEWYLDREHAVLYVYPPADAANAVFDLSLFPEVLLHLKEVSHVRFEGLAWTLGSADAIRVEGGERCLFAGCTVRQCGGNGFTINGGSNHGILSSDIYSMGRGGTVVSGGDRKTLAPGGHFVENCDIHDLSRIDHTYTPAVVLDGVGNRVAHNRMYDINSSALRVGGNDHLIEFNEVSNVLLESDDQGGADMWGNATFRGNVYRYNYWHHIGNWRHLGEDLDCGQAGIRLDDAISGTLIHGNIFYRCASGKTGFGGVQIHGGKDNLVENNIFAECSAAISFSAWGDDRWVAFVGNALEAPEIDAQLYRERYPQLATLTENANANTIQRNLVWRCDQFLLRDSGKNMVADNVITEADACFQDAAAGNFELKPDANTLLPPGFTPIPFAKIGLYEDAFRARVPQDAIAASRAGAE